MNGKHHWAFWAFLLVAPFVALLLSSSDLAAQCAMCRTALTTSAEGRRWARGINAGIMLLLVAPFIVVGLIALQIYARHVNTFLRGVFGRCQMGVSGVRRYARRPLATR